ncbi:MAG TPA: carboxypeptidase-like regulatory domain-containing protein [Candidatus Acidoferrum sp.]|jgi:hypothetical protein
MRITRVGAEIMVRYATIALFFLCYAEFSHAVASIEVIPCDNSSQRPVIHRLKATLSSGVLSTETNRPIVQLKIAKDGSIALPQLAPGSYLASVKSAEDIGATLCVNIGSDPSLQKSVFTLKLNPLSPPNPTLDELLATAKSKGVAQRVKELRGVVIDPAGMGIPGVIITGYKDGIQNKKHTRAIRSDKAGDFALYLSEGQYVVSFEVAGFKTRFITVEIAKDGEEKGVPVVLQFGEMSEEWINSRNPGSSRG